MRKCIALLFFLSISHFMLAGSRLSHEVSVAYSPNFFSDKRLNVLDKITFSTFSVQTLFGTKPGPESGPYEEGYNYPRFGVGFDFFGYNAMTFKDGQSYMNNAGAVYGIIDLPFYRNEWFSVQFDIGLGVGVTNPAYNPVSNPLSKYAIAPVYFFNSVATIVSFSPTKQLAINAGFTLKHMSTGDAEAQYAGLNSLGPVVGLSYKIDEQYRGQTRKLVLPHEFKKGLSVEIYGTYGLKIPKAELYVADLEPDPAKRQTKFTPKSRYGLGINLPYRYCLLCSTGLAVDFNYFSDYKTMEECDRILSGEVSLGGYSPFRASIGFLQEFHYKQFSAIFGASRYLYAKTGINEVQSKWFQRLGVKAYFSSKQRSYVAFNIRANKLAEYFELHLGIRI